MLTDASGARHTSDSAFHERATDRLVIRRFRTEDASSLAAYRSDPAIARYQSWDIPFTDAQARSFIDGIAATNPEPRRMVPVRCGRGGHRCARR
jgi:RimJ/RimL family protein N-acetyltransferase